MTDHGAGPLAPEAASPQPGEVAQRLSLLSARRTRGQEWYLSSDVTAVAQFADDRIALLRSEIDRKGREVRGLLNQVEMLRHGTLPSMAPQAADPMAVELTMRAQDEANRTIGEASEEGAEILAEARQQAEDIIAHAHWQASTITGHAGQPATDLQRRLQDLQARYDALLAVSQAAQENLARWQAYLADQAETMLASARAAGEASEQLQRALKE
jgi:cell division septum initiation protein DivIVA